MVSFNGEIREYPGLVVDEFSAHTHKRGKAFFLSHAHRDHMKGIKTPNFASILALSEIKLYTTEITKSILGTDKELIGLLGNIEIITVNCMLTLKLWDGLDVTVTPLPTGHCPGAVMLLFEGKNGNILYTGDFRLKIGDLVETRLYREETELITISTLYIDTTFCHTEVLNFISRETSRELILEKISDWLGEHKDNTVCLNFPCLGYEHIIMDVYTQLGIKMNVSETKLSVQYSVITCIRDCVTDEKSRIRIVSSKEGKTDPKSLNIKPSAQWFVNNRKLKSKCEYFEKFNFWRIQHSNHCSYTELVEFIQKIKPNRIVPIAIPVLSHSPLDAASRLKHLLKPNKAELKLQEEEVELSKKKEPNRIKRIISSLLDSETDDIQWEPVCKKPNQTEILIPNETENDLKENSGKK